MDTEQLMCPQLLSKETLEQILQERCIEVPGGIQSFDKEKLIDIYNRIALPFSQREYNNKRYLEKRLNDLRVSRNIQTVDYDGSEYLRNVTPNLEKNDKKRENINNHDSNAVNSNNNSPSSNKRIRLSNSTQNNLEVEEHANEQKKKHNIPLKTDSTKRQKITWP